MHDSSNIGEARSMIQIGESIHIEYIIFVREALRAAKASGCTHGRVLLDEAATCLLSLFFRHPEVPPGLRTGVRGETSHGKL